MLVLVLVLVVVVVVVWCDVMWCVLVWCGCLCGCGCVCVCVFLGVVCVLSEPWWCCDSKLASGCIVVGNVSATQGSVA